MNNEQIFEFFADFDGKATDSHVETTINELKSVCHKVSMSRTPLVPWFPTQIEQFDVIGKRILSSGDGI
jgi:hypothetical protein